MSANTKIRINLSELLSAKAVQTQSIGKHLQRILPGAYREPQAEDDISLEEMKTYLLSMTPAQKQEIFNFSAGNDSSALGVDLFEFFVLNDDLERAKTLLENAGTEIRFFENKKQDSESYRFCKTLCILKDLPLLEGYELINLYIRKLFASIPLSGDDLQKRQKMSTVCFSLSRYLLSLSQMLFNQMQRFYDEAVASKKAHMEEINAHQRTKEENLADKFAESLKHEEALQKAIEASTQDLQKQLAAARREAQGKKELQRSIDEKNAEIKRLEDSVARLTEQLSAQKQKEWGTRNRPTAQLSTVSEVSVDISGIEVEEIKPLVDEHTHDIAASGFRLSKKPTDKLPIRASYRAALVELRDFFKAECGENLVRLYGYGSQFEETDSGEANEGAQESTDMDLSLFIKEEKGLEHFLKKLSDRGFIHAVGRQDYPMMSLKLARGEVTVEIHAVVVGAQAEETLDKMMQARINDALCKQKAQYYDCIKETLLRSDEDFSILHLRDDFQLNLSVNRAETFEHADELALVLKLFFRNALRTRPLPVSIPMQRVVYDMMQHVDHPVVRLAFHLALKRYGLEYPEALKGLLSMFNVLGRMFDVTVKTSEKTDTQWIINVLKKFLKHVPEEQRERVTGTLKAWQEDIAQGIKARTGREIRPQTVEYLNPKHYFPSTPVSSPSPESSASSEPGAQSLQSPVRPMVSDASRNVYSPPLPRPALFYPTQGVFQRAPLYMVGQGGQVAAGSYANASLLSSPYVVPASPQKPTVDQNPTTPVRSPARGVWAVRPHLTPSNG